jgi:hypothetical protein
MGGCLAMAGPGIVDVFTDRCRGDVLFTGRYQAKHVSSHSALLVFSLYVAIYKYLLQATANFDNFWASSGDICL